MSNTQTIENTLLAKTGSYDWGYQQRRYEASKHVIAKALVTLVILFSMVGITDFFVVHDPKSVLELRLLFSPSFVLLIALLYLGHSFIVFYIASTLVLGGSAVCYALYIYDGSTLIAMYCTTVFVLTMLGMMPFLRTPLWISFIPSALMVASLAAITNALPFTEWFFCGGTLIGLLNIVFISELTREMDEYEIYREQQAIRRDQQKKLQWSFMTGRLLRHELSNQLIALSSSLDMLQRVGQIRNQPILTSIEKQTANLRNEINELALASEWSAKEESRTDTAHIFDLAISAFVSNDIKLAVEAKPLEYDISCQNKNICIYALNRLARTISSEFKELGLWGEIKFPPDARTLFEINLRSLPTEHHSAAHLFSTTNLSNETAGVRSAIELLKTEGVSLNLQLKDKEIKVAFEVAR